MKTICYCTFLLFLIIGSSCRRCIFEGYVCDSQDRGTTIKVNDKFYNYQDETIAYTIVNENDSFVYIDTYFTRLDGASSVNARTQLSYRFNLYLDKIQKDSFEINFDKSTATFVENKIQKDYLKLENGTATLIEYNASQCSQELNSSSLHPDRFIIKITGKVIYENQERNIELIVNFDTRKIEMKSC